MAEHQPIKRRLLDIHEVAEYMGVSIHTLYAMVSQRRIPFVKIGRLTKFDLKAIDAWIERHSVKPFS
jgi:excisionase family DNA binding protein